MTEQKVIAEECMSYYVQDPRNENNPSYKYYLELIYEVLALPNEIKQVLYEYNTKQNKSKSLIPTNLIKARYSHALHIHQIPKRTKHDLTALFKEHSLPILSWRALEVETFYLKPDFLQPEPIVM